MLAGLILRGVAFEYPPQDEASAMDLGLELRRRLVCGNVHPRYDGRRPREGLPIANGQYTGGDFGWLSPFAALCGVGLCLGYALLGACWLVKKCDAEIRDMACRQIPYLAAGVLVFLVVVFVYALAEHLQLMNRWLERPYLFVFPGHCRLAAATACGKHSSPTGCMAILYGRGHLRGGVWNPGHLVLALHDPFVITIDEAAAPHSSLAFMFWGAGIFIFPLMLLYTVVSYSVFRGKVGIAPSQYSGACPHDLYGRDMGTLDTS